MADPLRPSPAPRRRAVLLALATTGVLGGTLAGCARIPRSGPVSEGGTVEVQDEPGYRVEPVGPVDGATPEEVVRGFLLAGVGVDDDFRAARDFLTSARRASWSPTARTVVHPAAGLPSGLELVVGPQVAVDGGGTGDAGDGGTAVQVRVGTAVTAEVDPTGRYRPAAVGQRLDDVLTLVQEDGEWRITDAPDQLLLDESRFTRTFAPRAVVFTARGSDDLLVPDQRWLLDRASTATTLAEQVVAGPPTWLAPAVATGVPSGTTLPSGSVVVDAGVVTVDLPSSLERQRPVALRRLQRQLVATLGGYGSGVSQVRVTLDGGALSPTSSPALETGDPDALPVLVAAGQVVRLSGGQLVPVEGLPVLAGASSPAVLGDQVVVLLQDRTQVQRLVVDGDPAQAPPAVALGADLTPPSLDRYGWAWTTPAASDGRVCAVSAEGQVVLVVAAWLAGRRVVELRAAADGARLLVTSTGQAGLADAVRVDVAGISRTSAGVPEVLTADATPPTPWLSQVMGAVWVGATSTAVLGVVDPASAQAVSASAATQALAGSAPAVWLLDGGRATDLGGPPAEAGAVRVAGGTGRQSLVVGGADGRLWPLEGSRWLELAGVVASDPAYPG